MLEAAVVCMLGMVDVLLHKLVKFVKVWGGGT